MQKIKVQEGTHIEFSSNELLFLAHSGQPYRGSVYVAFDSLGESFDTQDFKRYLTSLRACTLNAEDIAYEIYSHINASIKSNELGVVVELTARGGIMSRFSYGTRFDTYKKNNIFQVG